MSMYASPEQALDRIKTILEEARDGNPLNIQPKDQIYAVVGAIEAVIYLHYGIEVRAVMAIIRRESEARLAEIQTKGRVN